MFSLAKKLSLTVRSVMASAIDNLFTALKGRATYSENIADSKQVVKDIDNYELLDKASILLTPTAYSNALVHSVKTNVSGEFVTDNNFPNFDNWTEGTGWTTSNGKAVHTQSVGGGDVYQVLNLQVGRKYLFKAKIDATSDIVLSNTAMQIRDNNNTFSVADLLSGASEILPKVVNDLELVFTATQVDNLVRFYSADEISIYDVSITDVSSDFDFDRASSATRINSDGLVQDMQSITDPELVLNGDFEELGDEEVNNGTFDLGSELNDLTWSAFGGWSIVDGVASNDGSGSTIVNEILEIGKTYKITIQLSTYTSGNFSVFLGSGTESSQFNGTDEFTFYGVCSGDAYVRVKSYSGIGSVDLQNISVKEVPDWTVTDSDANNYVEFTDGFARLKFLNTSPITMLNSSLTLQANKNYKLIVDVHDVTSGAIKIDSAGMSELFNTEGVTTRYLNPTGNTSLTFYRATADVDITLASVSVQELDPNDYWILGTGWSIGDGKASNDGSSGSNNLRQNDILTIGSTYKITITVSDYVSGNVQVSVGAAPRGTMSANGTYTFYQEATPTDDFYIIANAFEGSVSNISVQEIIDTNNIPRINYDSNGENGHWLLEPTSTNLLPYSEDFTTWTVSSGLSLTDNSIISPSGLNDGWKVESDGTSGFIPLRYAVSISGDNTFSVYAKQGTNRYITLRSLSGVDARANFDLQEGTSTSSNATSIIEDAGNGWYRCSMSFTGTNANVYIYPNEIGIADSGYIYLQFAQLEALSYATSYIPTLTGSTETRATETANGAGSADLINSTEGVLYAEIAALVDDSTNRVISLSDGTGSNVLKLFYKTSSNSMQVQGFVGGSLQLNRTQLLSDITQLTKIALRYKTNDFAWYINGVKVTTDTSTNTWSANTLYKLNFDDGNDGIPFYGKCKELTVFGEALSDDELEKLTSWSSFNAMATDLGYTIE